MSPESLVIIFLALAAGSFVKGISGLGLPLTAIPVMAGYMDVDRAVAIMVLPGVFLNFWLLWTYREHAVRIANLPASNNGGCPVCGFRGMGFVGGAGDILDNILVSVAWTLSLASPAEVVDRYSSGQ